MQNLYLARVASLCAVFLASGDYKTSAVSMVRKAPFAGSQSVETREEDAVAAPQASSEEKPTFSFFSSPFGEYSTASFVQSSSDDDDDDEGKTSESSTEVAREASAAQEGHDAAKPEETAKDEENKRKKDDSDDGESEKEKHKGGDDEKEDTAKEKRKREKAEKEHREHEALLNSPQEQSRFLRKSMRKAAYHSVSCKAI